ncbi:hypothetical protein TSOC_014878 [Tetrabaena socialis]|uniref:NYN domain-containing protein n=1 Tax=Tetrabaena socialis TaxID=47790 RepID=A0A2J7ZGH6_9CHLO|nr:hypothetical protein TSOC_014878 [Tetrabaena socialis]|eukprot:PNG99347.1 hypothetical protein TSOC_014878 [Tetrabaena socialis]
MAGSVYVFIDNSNTFIQASHTLAALEDAGQWGAQRTTRQLTNARIDYGCLVRAMLKGRQLGGPPLLVGSRPPQNDTLWEKLKGQGLDIKVFDRNAKNKEKKVDTCIVVEVMRTLYTAGRDGCTVALVAGDGDYEPLAAEIDEKGWKFEVYFWRAGADALTLDHTFTYSIELDSMYKEFSFATTSEHSKGRPHLDVSAPELAHMKNEAVLQQIVLPITGVFGWWDWVGDTELKLFFRDAAQQKRALGWLQANHPNWEVFQSA